MDDVRLLTYEDRFKIYRVLFNGDNKLENLKVGEEKWKVRIIEEEFKKNIWEIKG